MKNVAIYIFDEVEVLDFAGPFEVFNVAAGKTSPRAINVYTVANTEDPIYARGGLTIIPHYSIDQMPQPDILLIPGGQGTRPLLETPDVITWIQEQHQQVERLLSVCTGSLLLGKAGLLDGLNATTHHAEFNVLRDLAPAATVHEGKRYLDNGKIVTSAGVSAGIDMALYIIQQMFGEEVMHKTIDSMEYNWNPEVE